MEIGRRRRLIPRRILPGIMVLVLSAMGLLVAFAPPVHAATPVETFLSSISCSGSTCTAAETVTSGTTLVLHIGIYTSATTVVSVIGTVSGTWTSDVVGISPACASLCTSADYETWSIVTGTSSGTDALTVTLSGTPAFAVGKIMQINSQMFLSQALTTGGTDATNFNDVIGLSATIPAGGVVSVSSFAFMCKTDCTSIVSYTGPTILQNTPLTALSSSSTGQGNSHPGIFGLQSWANSANGLSQTFSYGISDTADGTGLWVTFGFQVVTWAAAPPAGTQTQTIGGCTATATGGTYLTNSTQFWYSANALGSEVVNTIQTQIENVKGSGSHTLQLVVYSSTNQNPSVANPANLAYSKSFVITSGTTNSTINLQVNIPLNTATTAPLPFNFWAVGIVGDDHIRIHNSAVSGMTTQTGAASTTAQPGSFTSSGTSTSTKLNLCATANYQNTLTSTTTTTTGGTTTSTFTSTVSQLNPNFLLSNPGNWIVMFLLLLLPVAILGGVARLGFGGAVAGLAIGTLMCFIAGIFQLWEVFFMVIVLLALVLGKRELDK